MRTWDPESRQQNLALVQADCPSPLFLAIFLRLEDVANHLVETRSYINGVGSSTYTTLQLASKQGYTDLTQKLVAAGENVDQTRNDTRTPLWIAVDNCDAQLVDTLLAAGANPNATWDPRGPALVWAIARKSLTIVKLLLAAGADANLHSDALGAPLQAAAVSGFSEIAIALLKAGAKSDTSGGSLGTPILAAATAGHSEVVKILVATGIAWDEVKDSTWHEAYDLWMSQSPRRGIKIADSYISEEPLERSDPAQMLIFVLGALSPRKSKLISSALESKKKSVVLKPNASRVTSQDITDRIRKQGLEGMDSGHYVYRALFWAKLLRCVALVRGFDPFNVQALTIGRSVT